MNDRLLITIRDVILFSSSDAIMWSHMGGGRNGPIQNSDQTECMAPNRRRSLQNHHTIIRRYHVTFKFVFCFEDATYGCRIKIETTCLHQLVKCDPHVTFWGSKILNPIFSQVGITCTWWL